MDGVRICGSFPGLSGVVGREVYVHVERITRTNRHPCVYMYKFQNSCKNCM